MGGFPPSVTAAVLKAVTVNRSLEEVAVVECDFGMCSVCVCVGGGGAHSQICSSDYGKMKGRRNKVCVTVREKV